MMFILETLDGIRYVAESAEVALEASRVFRPLFTPASSDKADYRKYDKIGRDAATGFPIFREVPE